MNDAPATGVDMGMYNNNAEMAMFDENHPKYKRGSCCHHRTGAKVISWLTVRNGFIIYYTIQYYILQL